MIDDYLAAIQLLWNWLTQFINLFSYASYVYLLNRITVISRMSDPVG